MAKKHIFRTSQIALAGAAFIWIVGFILYQIYYDRGTNYWMGFAFGLFALASAAGGIALIGRTNESTQETAGIPMYYTLIYVVIVAALNIFFAFTSNPRYITAFVIMNFAVLLFYVLLLYNANRYIKEVTERTEYAAAKMGNTANISRELAGLISLNTDAGVRKELVQLKETVDLSNNVSQGFSQKAEELFMQKLFGIRDAISEGADAETVTSKIKDAVVTWNMRNSSTNTIK